MIRSWIEQPIFFAAIFFLSACGSALYVPTQRDAERASERWPGTTLSELQAGRSVYVDNCSGCHQLPEPGRVTNAGAELFDEMALEARLTDEEKRVLQRYLAIASEVRPSPGS